MAKYSSQFVKLQRFIKDHKISYDALLVLLAEHFDERAPSDTQDASLAKGKNVPTAMEWDDVDAVGPSSSSGQSVDPARKDAVSGALPLQPNAPPPPQPPILPDEMDHPPVLESLPRVDIGVKSRSPKARRAATSTSPRQGPSYKSARKKAHQGAVVFHSNAPPPAPASAPVRLVGPSKCAGITPTH